jgi:hypothetical protein
MISKKEITGYVLAGIGIVAIALSYPALRVFLKLPALPLVLKDIYLMSAGAILLIVGVFLAFKARKENELPHEIPIYEGMGNERKIIALQRMRKK